MNRVLAILLGTVMFLSISNHAHAYPYCPQGLGPIPDSAPPGMSELVFPYMTFPEGLDVVTIFTSNYADQMLTESEIEEAGDDWNDACERVNENQHVPQFNVNRSGTRPPVVKGNDTFNTTLLVDITGTVELDENGNLIVAEFNYDTRTIELKERCPSSGTYGLPCSGPGGFLNWAADPTYTQYVIAHELGHALGLDEDVVDPRHRACAQSIMSPVDAFSGIAPPVTFQHCALSNQINDPDAPCNGEEPTSDENHPCDSEAQPEPDAHEHGDGESLFNRTPFMPIPAHPLTQCSYDCWSSNDYGWVDGQYQFLGVTVSCSYLHIPGESTTISTEDKDVEQPEELRGPATLPAIHGLSPRVKLDTPIENATVSGTISLSGWAMDFTGVGSVIFGTADTQVNVRNFRYGLQRADACTPPGGIGHVNCETKSGFTANLDTTQLPNGAQTLKVVATDIKGWPTVLERQIIVDNAAPGTPSPTPPTTVTVSVMPVQDAHVKQNYPRVNFGIEDRLLVRSTATGKGRFSFIQFPLGPMPRDFVAAKLKFTVAENPISDLWFYTVCDTGWNERRITWNNHPGSCGLINTYYSLTAGQQVELDVTYQVTYAQGRQVTFGLTTDDDRPFRQVFSRETLTQPVLEITYPSGSLGYR